MSDQSLSRDELASALLDGEVEGPSSVDPALATRVAEFRRAAEAIGASVPIDDVVRERAIEAALAEFDAPATSEPADAVSAAATIATTAALPRRSRWLPALAGAAAAVVVLIGAVAVLQRGESSSTDAASVAEQSPAAGASIAATTTAGLAASSADAAGEAAAAPNAPLPAKRDLGEISGDDQLRAALAPEQFTSTAANVGPDPCEAAARATVSGELGELAGSVTLRLEGQPARALLFIDAGGTDRIVVVADQTCEVLDQVD